MQDDDQMTLAPHLIQDFVGSVLSHPLRAWRRYDVVADYQAALDYLSTRKIRSNKVDYLSLSRKRARQ